MKQIRISFFCSLFLSFILLISPLPLVAMFENTIKESNSDINREKIYIYLDNKFHNISEFIFTLSKYDNDLQSPIHVLKNYISNGFIIGVQEDILSVLDYANSFLEQENNSIDEVKKNQFYLVLDNLIEAITEGILVVDSTKIDQTRHLPLLVINERIKVRGKARFNSEVIIYGKTRLHKPVRFYKRAHFKNNVRIDGITSMKDAVIENLTLSGGLAITDLTLNSLSVTDAVIDNLEVINCIADLCVESLSVVDGSVSGTLSINDAVIQTLDLTGGLVITDLTLNSLTVTDAVIDNLEVTNCIADLCIENLSVVDGSVSGTLSINDAVIQTLDVIGGLVITDLTLNSLTVTDAVIDNLEVTNCVPDLCVENLSVVEGSVSGTLSINDAVIQTLDLIGGLVITDLTLNSLTVTDAVIDNLEVTNCIADLCVENLSVVDGSVSGTLSINDAVIQTLDVIGGLSFTNVTLTTASITDAVISNLTVANCVTDLCVQGISVVDGTVSGTFSANDAVIQHLDIAQNSIHFLDGVGGQYVGVSAPVTVPTSYSVHLPSNTPLANQILRANATTPTDLEWANASGSALPTASKTIYVTKYGNDTTGDGSFSNPFLTVAKAINTANSIATGSNPISIDISTGIYIENNSVGPLAITAAGISIIGESTSGVVIMPAVPANTLLTASNSVRMTDITLASSSSIGTGLSLTAGALSTFTNMRILNFQTGVACSGSGSYGFTACLFIANDTAVSINNVRVQLNICTILGTGNLSGPAVNTGIFITGSAAGLLMDAGTISLCETGFNITNNCIATISAVSFKSNKFDIIQDGSSRMAVIAGSFEITDNPADIDIQVSGAGTFAEIIGCQFSGISALGVSQGTGLFVFDNAKVIVSSGSINNYATAIHIGIPSDTSSTELSASSFVIDDCTTDILQEGSSTLNFNASSASSSKILINDATNINLSFFDLEENNALAIGSTQDKDTILVQVKNQGIVAQEPNIGYKSNLYSTQAIGIENPSSNDTSLYAISNDNSNLSVITTDRTAVSNIRLMSDTGVPLGGTTALRGWDIFKNNSTAELLFNYQNNDSIGLGTTLPYNLMQLDGTNNKVQLPTVGTQIEFASDTNLFRDSANVLKTDDDFIIGTLTPNRVVITDSITNQLASSIVTNTELAFLSGVTSPIQTQLDNKVSRSGDTMTGTLQLPAGTTASPSLTFTGSTTAGLSANSGNISFSTNALERMKISSGGIISINGFTTAGVIHNDALGNLSSSLIVDADIDPAAAIVDTKLATISTAGKVTNSATTATSSNAINTIVLRDALGNFSAGTITANLTGTATNAVNFTGSLLGDVTGTQSATVVSFVGGQSAANVAAATVLANAATSANTANTIVRRDASGNFSAGTITANLTGSASNNVLKAGDTMTGALNMATQNEIHFQDTAGGEYVGINAPSVVPTSYTLSLPSTIPIAHQMMRANDTTPTNLEWFTSGDVVLPVNSRSIYVAKYGDDTTGDGSFAAPYASLLKAVDVANGLSTVSNPISIVMGSGLYIEDNSLGPISVTAEGISIVGDSPTAVIIMPTTLSNDLLTANQTVIIARLGFIAGGVSTAAAVSLTNGSLSEMINTRIIGFQTGVICTGGTTSNYAFDCCFFIDNDTGLINSDTVTECYDCTFLGSSGFFPTGKTGLEITGMTAVAVVDSGIVGICGNGFNVSNGANLTVNTVVLNLNVFDVIQTTGAQVTLSGCTFQYTTGPGDIDMQVSGAGTVAQILGCKFNGTGGMGPQAMAIFVSDNAFVNIIGGGLSSYTTGVQVGVPTDTSSTGASLSSFAIRNCTTDIDQQGSTSLNLNASTVSGSKIVINDPTNVTMSFFNLDDNNALSIGSTDDVDTSLIQVVMDPSLQVSIDYKASLYSSQAVGVTNPLSNPTSLYVVSDSETNVDVITTTRTENAGINLFSDTGSPVGGTTALRGWNINKNGSTAQLAFNYQNSDLVGQSSIPQYTVMQLDGVNNQVQLPTAATQLVFANDTNLYRDSANVLKTDDNLIVGTLTPGRVVITDSVTNQLASSVATDTEVGYLSGVTSSIQTQLNSKVAKAGDTMTGTLQLPAGSTALPSLTFTGSINTGLSANSNDLSFSNAGSESMKIASTGTVSINQFTTAGVVHNDASGNLSSSLIVDNDITNATISNAKLATISSSSTNGAIVVRDGSGNFETNMITLLGSVTNPTDAATKDYVDSVTSSGLVAKDPALVASTTDVTISGLQTIDGVALAANDRVLLVGQTNPVENGLWLAQVGAWTRPADFPSGSPAGQAYILVTSGNTYAGASWLSNTPNAIIDTDPLSFAQFSLPNSITGANVGAGTGQVFKNKTGVTLNFRTLLAGSHLTFTTNTDDISVTTDATNTNTASTIVARDASGNFSAGTITASLTGSASNNVLKAGDTMTGALQLPAGTTAAPSLVFTGSTTTGLSAATADTLSFSTAATERMKISSTGIVSIDGFTTAGVVHNDASGNLSSSLIVNADVDPSAAIVDTKLATISTAGKVANSATTATNLNTANAIVSRDASGNFNAGIISASLLGSASNNVLKAGDTMTGTLQLPAGSTALPSLVFTGSTTAGLSANTGNLSFSTNALERMKISSGGIISINGFTSTGVVHNDATGNLSTSLIVNADIDPAAAIVDTKLATISTAGKVANSATTATSTNTANTIVSRDASGNFSAGTITANLTGTASDAVNFTGSLLGDVTGTQGATVVSFVGGQSAANVATATVLANAATSANTANAIVRRDASGNFSAGTITANLTGSASNNVLKAGDAMTGTLNMATQNEIRFQDAAGGEYVGINAPSIVPTSYTVSLPTDVPVGFQILRANGTTPTNLEWFTQGGSIEPAVSRVIYVTQYGDDTLGNGSFDAPYASLAKAVDTANSLATVIDPIVIMITSGVYVEDNSSGPITVTAEGISIVGDSSRAVIIQPNTLSNDLLLINEAMVISFITLDSGGSSTATGLSITNGLFSGFTNLRVLNFQTGISCTGSASSYFFNNCLFIGNGIGMEINNTLVECNSCTFFGAGSIAGPSANTGMLITGAGADVVLNTGAFGLCATCIDINNNATVIASATSFRFNIFDIIQTTASQLTLSGCNFSYTNSASDIDLQISGAGTVAHISGCQFDGKSALGVTQGTGILISDNASVNISGGTVHNYDLGIQIGTSLDTSSTQLAASALSIHNCVVDIDQQGSSSLNYTSGLASGSKILINDPTNITLAYFDLEDDSSLSIGSTADVDTTLLQVAMNSSNQPSLEYKSSLYSSQAVGLNNPLTNPTSWFVASDSNTTFDAITTTRTQIAGINLFSDTVIPYGGTTALRGWSINKNGSAAELSFNYQNSDLIGQSSIPQYTVMQLDGINNQVQLPTASTQLVFASDTNLYRDSANVLKTDDNFIVETLTPGRAVITDSITNQLASSVVTNAELAFLSGVTSPVQTQLNNKVSRSGDTMTGTLQLPAGTTAAPSLIFTGSTTTGLSASSGDLSFSTNALERMKISSGGTISINGFITAGVVHNDASGNLSSSLIVNADVSASAAIVDTKLATISTAGKVANSATTATSANTASAIVARDASGNFTTNMITIAGTTTNATDVATKAYVDSTVGATGTNLNTPNTLVKRDNTGSFAAQTISLVDEVATGSITVTPFSIAGVIHNNASGLLSSSLIVNADVSASAAIVDTKLATISTAGKVANSATTATSANTANAIVARDASGNFTTNMITIAGTTTNATDVATKAYVDSVAGGTNLNTPNTLVKRDNTGSFAAQTISLVDEVISGNISMSDSTSSTVGNIIKNGTRFIHNFGSNNTFVGKNAGNFTMSGTGNNTAVGVSALAANITGANNTAIGTSALAANTTASNNTAVGTNALSTNTIGQTNTAIGSNALIANTTGNNNIAVGSAALAANTTGIRNIAIGVNSLLVNTTGQINVAIGHQALGSNTIGVSNVAVGDSALLGNTTGTSNTGIGANALLSNTIGAANTAVGLDSLRLNTTGTQNTAIGANALENNTIGTFNTAVGESCLTGNTTGVQNTAIGRNAGLAVTTGSNNVLLGYNIAATLSTGNNNIYIDGNSLNPVNESNAIRIGRTQTTCFIQGIRGVTTGQPNGITVLVDSNGQLGTISSSLQFKHNINDMNDISENIYKLRPVSFVYNSDVTETTQYGLIAEEVDQVFPELVIHEEDGSAYSVRYEVLPVLLLNEIQKQKQINEQHNIIINNLLKRVSALEEARG